MVNSESMDSGGDGNSTERVTQLNTVPVDSHSPSPVTAPGVCLRELGFSGEGIASTSAKYASPAVGSSPPETAVTGVVERPGLNLCCTVQLNKVADVLPKPKKFARKLLCLYCDRTFVTTSLRQKHVDRCHSSNQARRSSTRFQSKTPTVCIFCKKLNNSEHTLNDLFKHLVEKHSNKYFACVECEERFSFKHHLDEHNSETHPLKHQPKEEDEEEIINDEDKISSKHKVRLKHDLETQEEKRVLRKDLRKRKLAVKSAKSGLKKSQRLQKQQAQNKQKKRKSKIENSTKIDEKISTSINPYPSFDAFFRVKKITDHSIDNLKISSLTFDDVFDKAFYNRIKCNIQENLQNHIDGKLFKNEESETRISNFEKMQEVNTTIAENFGCDLTLNAATPVVSLLSSQLGEDLESQIEYGAKASKKKVPPKKDEVHYKYFTRRKYQASILENIENRDLSKLDMWTQLIIKDRQQKIINDQKTDKEKIEYTKGIEYQTKMKNDELNRILDRRGPFEDLKEEANKMAAIEKMNRLGDNINCEAMSNVSSILEEIFDRIFEKEIKQETEITEQKPIKFENPESEIPFYLKLRRSSSLCDQPDVDRSDKITLICSSQETENFEQTQTPRDKNTLVELTGEWTRTRIYICAACGMKVPNMKLLLDHKSAHHPNVWVQHFEFVGNQSDLYRHMSIPGLGKVGYIEDYPMSKTWKRSEARTCTKCSKMCNSLAELHRHMLECGEDWSWMLARKKLKYRPFGAKSRRKKRGLVKRIIHKEKSEQDTSERKKKYKVKPHDGPRQKPSDAETIQRMLANLPAKRATRKLISLKDGFPRQVRRKSQNEPPKEVSNRRSSTRNQSATSNNHLKGLKCNPVKLRKSVRNINKVFGSKILDTNSTLIVKRKLKTALRQTRARKAAQKEAAEEESPPPEESAPSTDAKKTKSIMSKVKMIGESVKKVFKSSDKKSKLSGGRETSDKNQKSKRSIKSEHVEEISEFKTPHVRKSIRNEALETKKESLGTRIARSLSMRRTRRHPPISKSVSDTNLSKKKDEILKNGKRKSTFDNLRSKLKKIRKEKPITKIAQVDGSSQISDEILPFLENFHLGERLDNQEKKDLPNVCVSVTPRDVSTEDTIEAQTFEDISPNLNKSFQTLTNLPESSVLSEEKTECLKEIDDCTHEKHLPTRVENISEEIEKEISPEPSECTINKITTSNLISEETISTIKIKEEPQELNEMVVKQNQEEKKLLEAKLKMKKKHKGLNDCIAMLTSKLQQRSDDTYDTCSETGLDLSLNSSRNSLNNFLGSEENLQQTPKSSIENLSEKIPEGSNQLQKASVYKEIPLQFPILPIKPPTLNIPDRNIRFSEQSKISLHNPLLPLMHPQLNISERNLSFSMPPNIQNVHQAPLLPIIQSLLPNILLSSSYLTEKTSTELFRNDKKQEIPLQSAQTVKPVILNVPNLTLSKHFIEKQKHESPLVSQNVEKTEPISIIIKKNEIANPSPKKKRNKNDTKVHPSPDNTILAQNPLPVDAVKIPEGENVINLSTKSYEQASYIPRELISKSPKRKKNRSLQTEETNDSNDSKKKGNRRLRNKQTEVLAEGNISRAIQEPILPTNQEENVEDLCQLKNEGNKPFEHLHETSIKPTNIFENFSRNDINKALFENFLNKPKFEDTSSKIETIFDRLSSEPDILSFKTIMLNNIIEQKLLGEEPRKTNVINKFKEVDVNIDVTKTCEKTENAELKVEKSSKNKIETKKRQNRNTKKFNNKRKENINVLLVEEPEEINKLNDKEEESNLNTENKVLDAQICQNSEDTLKIDENTSSVEKIEECDVNKFEDCSMPEENTNKTNETSSNLKENKLQENTLPTVSISKFCKENSLNLLKENLKFSEENLQLFEKNLKSPAERIFEEMAVDSSSVSSNIDNTIEDVIRSYTKRNTKKKSKESVKMSEENEARLEESNDLLNIDNAIDDIIKTVDRKISSKKKKDETNLYNFDEESYNSSSSKSEKKRNKKEKEPFDVELDFRMFLEAHEPDILENKTFLENLSSKRAEGHKEMKEESDSEDDIPLAMLMKTIETQSEIMKENLSEEINVQPYLNSSSIKGNDVNERVQVGIEMANSKAKELEGTMFSSIDSTKIIQNNEDVLELSHSNELTPNLKNVNVNSLEEIERSLKLKTAACRNAKKSVEQCQHEALLENKNEPSNSEDTSIDCSVLAEQKAVVNLFNDDKTLNNLQSTITSSEVSCKNKKKAGKQSKKFLERNKNKAELPSDNDLPINSEEIGDDYKCLPQERIILEEGNPCKNKKKPGRKQKKSLEGNQNDSELPENKDQKSNLKEVNVDSPLLIEENISANSLEESKNLLMSNFSDEISPKNKKKPGRKCKKSLLERNQNNEFSKNEALARKGEKSNIDSLLLTELKISVNSPEEETNLNTSQNIINSSEKNSYKNKNKPRRKSQKFLLGHNENNSELSDNGNPQRTYEEASVDSTLIEGIIITEVITTENSVEDITISESENKTSPKRGQRCKPILPLTPYLETDIDAVIQTEKVQQKADEPLNVVSSITLSENKSNIILSKRKGKDLDDGNLDEVKISKPNAIKKRKSKDKFSETNIFEPPKKIIYSANQSVLEKDPYEFEDTQFTEISSFYKEKEVSVKLSSIYKDSGGLEGHKVENFESITESLEESIIQTAILPNYEEELPVEESKSEASKSPEKKKKSPPEDRKKSKKKEKKTKMLLFTENEDSSEEQGRKARKLKISCQIFQKTNKFLSSVDKSSLEEEESNSNEYQRPIPTQNSFQIPIIKEEMPDVDNNESSNNLADTALENQEIPNQITETSQSDINVTANLFNTPAEESYEQQIEREADRAMDLSMEDLENEIRRKIQMSNMMLQNQKACVTRNENFLYSSHFEESFDEIDQFYNNMRSTFEKIDANSRDLSSDMVIEERRSPGQVDFNHINNSNYREDTDNEYNTAQDLQQNEEIFGNPDESVVFQGTLAGVMKENLADNREEIVEENKKILGDKEEETFHINIAYDLGEKRENFDNICPESLEDSNRKEFEENIEENIAKAIEHTVTEKVKNEEHKKRKNRRNSRKKSREKHKKSIDEDLVIQTNKIQATSEDKDEIEAFDLIYQEETNQNDDNSQESIFVSYGEFKINSEANNGNNNLKISIKKITDPIINEEVFEEKRRSKKQHRSGHRKSHNGHRSKKRSKLNKDFTQNQEIAVKEKILFDFGNAEEDNGNESILKQNLKENKITLKQKLKEYEESFNEIERILGPDESITEIILDQNEKASFSAEEIICDGGERNFVDEKSNCAGEKISYDDGKPTINNSSTHFDDEKSNFDDKKSKVNDEKTTVDDPYTNLNREKSINFEVEETYTKDYDDFPKDMEIEECNTNANIIENKITISTSPKISFSDYYKNAEKTFNISLFDQSNSYLDNRSSTFDVSKDNFVEDNGSVDEVIDANFAEEGNADCDTNKVTNDSELNTDPNGDKLENAPDESEFLDTPTKSNKLKSKKGKSKRGTRNKREKLPGIENLDEVYCDICNRSFTRMENLVKHKKTLTHIAKLSEIEAREAEIKAKQLENEKLRLQLEEEVSTHTETINVSDYKSLKEVTDYSKTKIGITDILAPEKNDTSRLETPFIINPNSDTLNLADIINKVLDKPLANDKIYDENYVQTSKINTETKRYKSLGERKSFESDMTTNYPFSNMHITSDLSPKIPNAALLKQQISILENIIESEGTFGYMDEVSESSNKSRISCLSMASEQKSEQTQNTFMKPSENFLKPLHYEEISNDSSSIRNNFEDQRSRKVLNNDEALFLECCSLLKSSSEVSGFSKKSSKQVLQTTFEMKQTDAPDWLEAKSLKAQPFQNNFDHSSPPTPLGDGFGDEYSNTNSNTIATDWSTKQKEKEESRSYDQRFNYEQNNYDEETRPTETESERNFGHVFDAEKKSCEDMYFSDSEESDRYEGDRDETDEEFKERLTSRFSGIMNNAWKKSVESVKKHKRRRRQSETQTSITDYTVPISSKLDPSDKKIVTKGAKKIFEGLKISIPTDDIDLKELLNGSYTKQPKEISKITREPIFEESRKSKKRSELKKNAIKNFGNSLGLRITKKKHVSKSKDFKKKNENSKKDHDVYDFEETLDNVDIFEPKLTNIKEFRNKEKEKKLHEPPLVEIEDSADDDRECLGGFEFDAHSASSYLSETSSSKQRNLLKTNKNDFRSKIDEEYGDIPVINNSKLVADYVSQLSEQNAQKKKKLSAEEMNDLFNKLLDDKLPSEGGYKRSEEMKSDEEKQGEGKIENKKEKHKTETPKTKNKSNKRKRRNSETTDDEFSINKPKRYSKKRSKNAEDNAINLEQELRECIGVASRKSQRTCTSGKQNVLVEYWSSDDSNFEAFIRETMSVEQHKPPKPENPKETQLNSENKKRKLSEPSLRPPPQKEVPSTKQSKPEKVKAPRRKSATKHKKLDDDDPEDKQLRKVKVTAETLAANRRKRAAADTLYYWSSSSEDDFDRTYNDDDDYDDDDDDDDDFPLQHGWIVGESPKKLMTMLAQAKGKKTDFEAVKQPKKRTTM